ncbi:hypothetical protein N1851_022556 [Merluccius polli]|uniref:Photoreceptor cilium actin regulator n=1 Tax=Merluccius polli TaxID=89951 RepID=A0AA47MHQ1_MERPO|nr:hypothetical protein N1851_022556 [Merluccius polli]
MGSSASKGKRFPGPEDTPALQAGEVGEDLKQSEEKTCLEMDTHVEEAVPPPTQDVVLLLTQETQETEPPSPPDPDVGVVRTTESVAEMDVPPLEESAGKEILTDSTLAKTEKKRKPKGAEKRRRTEMQRKASVGTKADLPLHMVRAHQAAYAYLNPNISKYDTLLGLLDQAAQTHLSLQPMMSVLVLCFEEINQALEEMAEEGELMMREHGDYMAWPVTGKTAGPPYVTPAKPDDDVTHPPDPPPDLLQQLLQHSTEKMILVGSSFQGMGNATLEEKAEYFASLSRLLSDKLRAKRVAEGRLAQVLLHVQRATVRGSHVDDIPLHSEDSGIGGENESLAGSEKHRRHRGSTGSGSCGSGGNVRALLDSPPNPFQNHGGLNEGGEEEEEEEEDEEMEEEEENEEQECDTSGRKRSNSSPPDPSRPLANMASEHLQHRRPMTAVTTTKPQCFQSTSSSDPITELQQSQRDLDQRMMNRRRGIGEGGSTEPYCNTYRRLRRHSLSGSGADGGDAKGPLGECPPLGGLPVAGFAPRPPGRDSVRRLINTFSQGVDGRPGQRLANIPPHIKRPRRSGGLILPDIGTAEKSTNGNNNNNSWPDSRDDLDVDSLPPPPPEVLLDDSFQSTEENQRNPGRPVTYPRTRLSQRLRASVQNVSVLPNRASVIQNTATSAGAIKPDPEQDLDDDVDQETEKATTLYQQAQKIIHLRNAAGSHHHLPQLDAGPPHRLHEADLHEAEPAQCTPPITAPPVSRVRLPPSCPSVAHQRFPSPPGTVAPSRPSCPRTVASARDSKNEEIVPMVAFRTARSVFCQMENQTGEACSPTLHRPWGDPPRGRQAAQGAGTSSRRTQSEQRPGVNSQLEMPVNIRRKPIQARNAECLVSSKAGRYV